MGIVSIIENGPANRRGLPCLRLFCFLCTGEGLQFLHPLGVHRVGGHLPVAPRGEGERTDFRSVREAGAFELLGKEALVEVFQPFEDGLPVVVAAQRMEGQPEYFPGGESPPDGVVKEEVVKFIGAHQVLGFLGDLSLLRGEEFRGDRGVQNVPEDGGQPGVGGFRLTRRRRR